MKKVKTSVARVLVLGIDGMVGRIVYKYLHDKEPACVSGTTRNRKDELLFRAEEVEKDLKSILSRMGKVDFVINCIGKLRSYPLEDMMGKEEEYIQINSLLPLRLSQLASTFHFRLIHISTDAVFSSMSKLVDESTLPSAQDVYSASKLLGEPLSPASLSVRTSFIGCSPKHGAGLIELVRKNKNRAISGFTNQKWSGCTTIQFAQFVHWLIVSSNFEKVRTKTHVVHFVPLGPVSKYKVLMEIANVLGGTTPIQKSVGTKVTRILGTKHASLLRLTSYGSNLRIALQGVISYEET